AGVAAAVAPSAGLWSLFACPGGTHAGVGAAAASAAGAGSVVGWITLATVTVWTGGAGDGAAGDRFACPGATRLSSTGGGAGTTAGDVKKNAGRDVWTGLAGIGRSAASLRMTPTRSWRTAGVAATTDVAATVAAVAAALTPPPSSSDFRAAATEPTLLAIRG